MQKLKNLYPSVSLAFLGDYAGFKPKFDMEIEEESYTKELMTFTSDLLFSYQDEISGLREELMFLKEHVQKLELEQKKAIVYEFEDIPTTKAKKMIIDYLKKIKKEKSFISVFEVSQKLKIPANQVEEIMDKIVK